MNDLIAFTSTQAALMVFVGVLLGIAVAAVAAILWTIWAPIKTDEACNPDSPKLIEPADLRDRRILERRHCPGCGCKLDLLVYGHPPACFACFKRGLNASVNLNSES